MIRHVVMYWLKDPAQIEKTIGILRSMEGKIPGLLKIEAGRDTLHSDRSCDLCLNTLFESAKALEAYRTHPVHIPVQQHMHGVTERSVSADYEVTVV
jgi:hypothetical protein